MLKLTPYTGKRSPTTGGWSIEPSPIGGEKLTQEESGFGEYFVQIRPDILTVLIPDDLKSLMGILLDQLASTGEIGVILKHGIPDKRGRSGTPTVKKYKQGEVYGVKINEALRLLNSTPYSYFFEEVADSNGKATPADPNDRVAVLAEENEALKQRLARLESLIANLGNNSPVASINQSRSSSLKHLED